MALVAWRSGHPICLTNRRPGFTSGQGVTFLENNIEILLCITDLKCNVCAFRYLKNSFCLDSEIAICYLLSCDNFCSATNL
jgi:hypothetical protein